MTIKVTIAHSQPHYNRLIEVVAVTPGVGENAGVLKTLAPGEAGTFFVHLGQQLLVREVPDGPSQG